MTITIPEVDTLLEIDRELKPRTVVLELEEPQVLHMRIKDESREEAALVLTKQNAINLRNAISCIIDAGLID